jgi:1,4-alpha-glucan branching enzyme
MIRRARAAADAAVKVTFVLPADTPAGPVSVVGDFNDWTPGAHSLVKRANGTRSVAITLPASTVARFRYLADDGEWFDDPDADEVDSQGSTLRL